MVHGSGRRRAGWARSSIELGLDGRLVWWPHWIFDLSGPLGVDEVRPVAAGGEEFWQARRERACDTWSGEEDTGACYDSSRKDEFTLMNDSPLQIAAIASFKASRR